MALPLLLALATYPGANAFREILVSETDAQARFEWDKPGSHNDSEKLFAWAERKGVLKAGEAEISISLGHFKQPGLSPREAPRTAGPSSVFSKRQSPVSKMPMGDSVKSWRSRNWSRVIAHADLYTVSVICASSGSFSSEPVLLEFLGRRVLARAIGLETTPAPKQIVNGKPVTIRVNRAGVRFAAISQFAKAKGWEVRKPMVFDLTLNLPNRLVKFPLAANLVWVNGKLEPAGGFVFIADNQLFAPLQFLESL